MRFFSRLFQPICLLFAIESRQVIFASARKQKILEEAEFWARVEKDIVGSFDSKSSTPTARFTSIPSTPPPPSMMPSPGPTPIPSSKPSFSSVPSYSSAPTFTLVPTITARPTQSSQPSTPPPSMMSPPGPTPMPSSKPLFSSVPSYPSAPTFTTVPSVTAKPTESSQPSSSVGPSYSNEPTSTARPTTSAYPSSSSKPSFSSASSLSSAPTLKQFQTNTESPTVSVKPSISAAAPSSVAPSHSSAPTSSLSPTATLNPTLSEKPSYSAVPSHASSEPSSTACTILADIACISEGNGSCDFFNPVGEQCIGGNAQELRFMYTSNSFCRGNNTQEDFICVDEITPDQFRPSSVYIKAFLEDSMYYEGIVNEGNVFSIFVTDDSDLINVEIRDLTNTFNAGSLLQRMTMSVQCREEDSLILPDTFGGLQLVGYRNEDQGLKSIYTDLVIQYVASNMGSRNVLLTSVIKTTPMTGTLSLLPMTESIFSVPGYTEVFSELLTVNLAAIVGGLGLEFSIFVKGEDTATGNECEDSASYTLKINEA